MAGRGGAGNIEAANRRFSRDIESSQSLAESNAHPTPIELALEREHEERKVAHTGRGGAGNAINPSELMRTGQFHGAKSADNAAADNDPNAIQGEKVHRMVGRGGAGNYDPEIGILPSKHEAQAHDQSQVESPKPFLREEADVEMGLPKPDAAYLGPKERQKDMHSLNVTDENFARDNRR
ncbi:MAG: hypothetical protein Q9159_004233 [Coniocarpon cinnabarinum]